MKKVSTIMWGLILIAIGVILGGNALGWFNIEVFFDGWWTLFIIVPCAVGLVTDKDRTGHLIGLLIGVCLLLACQNVIGFDSLWKLLVPGIIILIGLSMIFKSVFNNKFNKATKKLNEKYNKGDDSGAVFGGVDINMAGKEFKGKDVNAVFGGMSNKRKTAPKAGAPTVYVTGVAMFGGIEVK